MKIIKTPLNDLVIIEPQFYEDERGFFLESFQAQRYQKMLNKKINFVQDNLSYSKKNVLRGLHYQLNQPQDKLITIIKGCVFDVALDLRKNSSTFGKWHAEILSDENRRQFFIPKGFAHGFCVLSEFAHFHYKCSNYYCSDSELGVLWSDPTLSINWPIKLPILSFKDKQHRRLKNISTKLLFSD